MTPSVRSIQPHADTRRRCNAISRHAWTLAAAFVALPAQAYLADSDVNANDSSRRHNTSQGVTIERYNGPIASGGGSTGIGGTVSTSFVSDTDSFNSVPYSGYAYGSANLNTGSLHAVANTTFGQPVASGFAQSIVRWVDDITFITAGASASTTRQIVVDLQLNGGISRELFVDLRYGFKMSGIGGGGGQISRFTLFDNEPGPSAGDNRGTVDVLGFADGWQIISNTVSDMHFRGLVNITGPSKTFNLDTSLYLRCTDGTSCNYGDSAHLRLELPPDVSFTSGSGVLLTAAAGAVPEPGSGALLLAGLLASGWAARRRMTRRSMPLS